jgi:peptide/nickel transport system ATP-binding protein
MSNGPSGLDQLAAGAKPHRAASSFGEAQTPVLSISGLTTSFIRDGQRTPVVRNVSFDVAAKETVAIVGESGSGKSVTALSIMRLIPRESGRIQGSIKLAGRDLLTLPEQAMQDVRGNEVAMIFQEPMTSLNPVLTIGFQIAEALIYHRGMSRSAAEAETIRLLEKVRIPAAKSRFHEYPHRFSGGMRQRVMIAMALACKPKLLIADEPTTALDVTIQAQILELLKVLQEEEDMSILFITHDMGVVAEIADRTVVMYDGQAVETDSTAQIFAAPSHPYTRALLSAVPRLGSMEGRARPMRFPIVDKVTGTSDEPTETPDTVATTERPVLEVANLTTRFAIRSGLFGKVSGRVHAVENISFSLHAGETLALVGESGCGKSTTGRSILKLIEPDSGAILIDGEDVLGMNTRTLRELRKRMQIVFQDPFASLNPRMSVGSAIAAPLYAHGLASSSQARDRVADLLVRVGLTADMASRFPHEFSGGQRQRICIARALALGPKLIIADEAVSALDVSVKAQVVNLMLDLQASMGLAYLFISHDIAVVERMSHRVAVMYLGEIVEIGPRAAVFGNPQHPYTKKLMAAVPIPDPARRAEKRGVSNDEIKSPVRAPDYQPPVRQYREVTPGHVVQVWGEEWPA